MRSKVFSAINIAGLAIGMASVILISLWLQNMISTDRFYSKEKQLYVLSNRDNSTGTMRASQRTPRLLGTTMMQEHPEVEQMTRVGGNYFLFRQSDKQLNASGCYVDTGFFNMFDMQPLRAVSNTNPLAGNDQIVLTKSFAKTLFGSTDPLGKTLKLDNKHNVTVSGVIKDLPNNTQFDFNYLLSWKFEKKVSDIDDGWGNNSVFTFIQLHKNTNLVTFNSKIKNITIEHSRGTDPQPNTVFAFPLKDRFLYNQAVNGAYVSGNIVIVSLFSIVALLILIIACINFMNLSTARSEKRAKEVGVRKVIGAYRRSLTFQFLSESILLAFLAFIMAVGIVLIALPFFNQLIGKELTISFGDPYAWALAMAFILFTGLLAGSYPALFLSSFEPVKVLKGTFRRVHSKFNLRSLLVVTQFTFSIVLIIATIIVSRQIHYTEQRDKGYADNGLLYTLQNDQIDKNYQAIKNDLLSSGAITSISRSFSPITQNYGSGWGAVWPGSTPEDEHTSIVRFSSDADFIKTMGAHLIAGRDIDIYKYPSDSTACLLNETAAKMIGVKDPVGLTFFFDDTVHVVGVIKDLVITGVTDKTAPMVIGSTYYYYNALHYRLNPNRPTADCLKQIKGIFDKYCPSFPFQYSFVDKDYAKKFEELQQTSRLSGLFAGLTITISCLGLLGLVMFMAETRTKEIGIRKVLGASVFNITRLLSWQFFKLVVVAFVIAAPIAWYAMHRWLESYDYRVNIHWWWFVLAGFMAIIVAMLTVGWQALRAAKVNPVHSIKSE